MSRRRIERVLVANRGEIAVRITRTCHGRGLEVVTVHEEKDVASPHVAAADAARQVSSYLAVDELVSVAVETGCQAVHPGYGFLSENPRFARALREAGVVLIGPPAEAMEVMGSKTAARDAMAAAGVPVVPGSPAGSPEELAAAVAGVGLPVFVKASGGGGGKGMAIVDRAEDVARVARLASDEAERSFGDAAVYLERVIERPRHVEVQVFGDEHGTVVALGERECSVQRRHQKVVEESPSPAVDAELRERLEAAAVRAAEAVRYVGAGTVEFLLGPDRNFYFLEMNTRLQVEHPVTECVTGLDLVGLQLDVAEGLELPANARRRGLRGHAIECRVYAEDPRSGHLPQAGPLLVHRPPEGPGIRVDAGVIEGGEVTVHYDPMLSKLITWGADRAEAIARMREALSRYVVLGVRTNLELLHAVLSHEAFAAGDLTTAFLDEHLADALGPDGGEPPPAALATLGLPATASRGAGTVSRVVPDPWETLSGFRSSTAEASS